MLKVGVVVVFPEVVCIYDLVRTAPGNTPHPYPPTPTESIEMLLNMLYSGSAFFFFFPISSMGVYCVIMSIAAGCQSATECRHKFVHTMADARASKLT